MHGMHANSKIQGITTLQCEESFVGKTLSVPLITPRTHKNPLSEKHPSPHFQASM